MSGRSKRGAFTLVELLTAVAVIAILIGLLVPAFSLIQKSALAVRQKGQFSQIGTALEGYRSDMGDYPPSSRTGTPGDRYEGAQKLAEAIIGWDGFGFHPRSVFSWDGTDNPNGGGTARVYLRPTDPGWDTNLKERKGPYLELEAAGAVRLGDLIPSGAMGELAPATYVLVDSFKTIAHQKTRKMTGMPILYYRANESGIYHRAPTNPLPLASDSFVYDVRDNRDFFLVPRSMAGAINDELSDQPSSWPLFYDATTNPNFFFGQGDDRNRPYRADSFILHSAGPDGRYGTGDDMYNFEKDE